MACPFLHRKVGSLERMSQVPSKQIALEVFVRWLAILPAAVGAAFVADFVGLIVIFRNPSFVHSVGLWCLYWLVAGSLSACAFVAVGEGVAPSHRRWVALVLAASCTVAFGILGLWEALRPSAQNWVSVSGYRPQVGDERAWGGLVERLPWLVVPWLVVSARDES